MQLQEFVTESLTQIIQGVRNAHAAAKTAGAQVNPIGLAVAKPGSEIYSQAGQLAQLIHFDVAVTATETDKAQGGIGVFVGALAVGTKGEVESQSSAISRIQFSVPVVLPHQAA